ncbi:hypothetical protein [Brevibacillus laterosporus]|uniref:Uncharacterized protein n=1 Tax=Brevibacillus laterosporus TaxID=1465 RepID=A0AAP3G9T5_BRELA|nr:hypothetical protein [Brevibacillus laterosporus]MCR8981796.1 hypothetical protein [Brevibacillus laterosporus]MCZ0808951.1 hypothetical protein [Brevibacillus laterosporus]MCZ0827309.1 hypothetical protein [Brevibacillus laterosporus]MCZ0851334.1 hypothetical protein [Brevibacillus laterosporus]
MTVMEKIKQMEDELQRLKQEVEKAEQSKTFYIDDETSHDVLTEVYN